MVRRLLPVIAAVFAVLAAPAFAQGGRSVFVVAEVPVSATADTAAEAQRLAQDRGRRRALDILLRRMTAEADWDYLPTFSTGQEASAGFGVVEPQIGADELLDTEGLPARPPVTAKRALTLDGRSVASLEEGFSIFDEKSASGTYRAAISYRFKPAAIRQLLETAGLPYSEEQARRALVLPVLETDTGLYLWESKNAWARAWLARPLINELTPIVLPNGDRQDMMEAPVQAVRETNQDALQSMATRYRVPTVLVAQGKVEAVGSEYLLNVKLVDAGVATEPAVTGGDRQARLYDDEDGFGTASATATVGTGRAPEVVVDVTFRGPSDDFPALAERAVEAVVARYASDWKQRTLVDHTNVRSVRLIAWFSSLDEWAAIRGALEGTPLVRNMDVGAFNNENAVIDLAVLGDDGQFTLAMSQRNLVVWQGADGAWNIARPAQADRVQSRLRDVNYDPRAGEGGASGQAYGDGLGQPMNAPSGTRGTIQGRVSGGEPAPAGDDLRLPDDFGAGVPQVSGRPVGLDPSNGGPQPLTPGQGQPQGQQLNQRPSQQPGNLQAPTPLSPGGGPTALSQDGPADLTPFDGDGPATLAPPNEQ